jgi:hypothetical protein
LLICGLFFLGQFSDHIGCKVVLITGFQIRGFHIDEKLQLIFDLDEIRSISVVNQDRSTTRRGSRAGYRSDRVKKKEKAAAAHTRNRSLVQPRHATVTGSNREKQFFFKKKKYADPIAHTDRQIRVLERDPRLLASLALLSGLQRLPRTRPCRGLLGRPSNS